MAGLIREEGGSVALRIRELALTPWTPPVKTITFRSYWMGFSTNRMELGCHLSCDSGYCKVNSPSSMWICGKITSLSFELTEQSALVWLLPKA